MGAPDLAMLLHYSWRDRWEMRLSGCYSGFVCFSVSVDLGNERCVYFMSRLVSSTSVSVGLEVCHSVFLSLASLSRGSGWMRSLTLSGSKFVLRAVVLCGTAIRIIATCVVASSSRTRSIVFLVRLSLSEMCLVKFAVHAIDLCLDVPGRCPVE
jgi:hypothetical protein